jgi:peptidoglycan-associated lipoprotein
MARSHLFVTAAFALAVACKKQVEVTDLPSDAGRSGAPAAVASSAPPDVFERMERNFQRVFFEYDSATLGSSSRDALMANVAILQEYPELSLLIQGHCDERGTTDYNLALGDRRAQAVVGVMRSEFVIVSGELGLVKGTAEER